MTPWNPPTTANLESVRRMILGPLDFERKLGSDGREYSAHDRQLVLTSARISRA